MNKFDYEKFNKRYEKFKKNNLPTPFWDEERQTHEYVYFSEVKSNGKIVNQLQVSSNLAYALEGVVQTSLYYPFTTKIIFSYKENGKLITKMRIDHSHAHSFEEVLREVYYSPESFAISKEEEEFYSKQELKYLKRVQNYLLLLGIKDFETIKIPVSRYRNKAQKKYQNVYIKRLRSEYIKQIIEGKIDFLVLEYFPELSKEEKYKPKEYTSLIVDENENFKLLLEFTKSEIKDYKEIKKVYQDKNIKEDEKVNILYFKVIEIFESKR